MKNEEIYDYIIRIQCNCDVIYREMKGKHHCDIVNQLEKRYKICKNLSDYSSWSASTEKSDINAYENDIVKVEIVRMKEELV